MSFEDRKSSEGKDSSPLENFFKKMHPEDQRIIETDFFNSNATIPLENALSTITDLDEARMLMHDFSEYIKDREFLTSEQRSVRIHEALDFIDRRI